MAAKHGSFSLLVFLCVLYSLFIKLDCQLPQDSIGGFVFCSASSNRSSFPQKLKVASRKQEFFDDQPKYLSCITARGTVSVPLQHGSGPLLQCTVLLWYRSGPLLQRAVPPQYRFGTARALYYNARRRLGTASVPLGPSITMRGADTPVCVLQSFNSVGVMNFQENTKTNRNPQNATLNIVVPALLQTGRSTLAPRHSKYSSRSTILNKGLGVGLAIDVSKVKLHFRVNLWPSFWGPKTLAKTGVATEGLPSSRTCVDINVRRVWRTSTRGAAKPWKPSGMGNFCRVHEETIETCAFFRSVTTILPTKRPPFWGPKTDPKMESIHSVSI